MPRIRTVKPEAPQHRKVGRLHISARWLWLTMLTQADDEGRLVADPGQLRILAFPYDRDVTEEAVADLLAAIAATGLIRLYEVHGVPYADFPSWRDHQVINRPSPSKLPAYHPSLIDTGVLTEPSRKTPGALQEHSRRTPEGVEGKGSRKGSRIKDQGSEGRGKGVDGESEGKEGTGDVSPAPPRSLVAPGSNNDNPHGHDHPQDTSTPAGKGTASRNDHGPRPRVTVDDYNAELAATKARYPEWPQADLERRVNETLTGRKPPLARSHRA